ncbi:hypothetical protein NDU88_007096 [Pleurodeles waltl]|uniref:Kinesin motor domain-containing protein n=1 Tax=Pleurodeles waltl TaxID=8319 RepID=A0AAV7RPW7_PLEWA|nr:hypothetical protein NDU88_007096 [Pleurodeles waltl]
MTSLGLTGCWRPGAAGKTTRWRYGGTSRDLILGPKRTVTDLLSKTKKAGGLKVREDQQQGFYVDGLKLVPCESYSQIERLMEQGAKIRTTASTSMNASSSRSHMVITIQFKQLFLEEDITKQSIINLVDLAGSERQKSSGSEGDRLREGTCVNLSLTTLGNVIRWEQHSCVLEGVRLKNTLKSLVQDGLLRGYAGFCFRLSTKSTLIDELLVAKIMAPKRLDPASSIRNL